MMETRSETQRQRWPQNQLNPPKGERSGHGVGVMKFALVVAMVVGFCGPADALFVADEDYATVGWWHIGHDKGIGKGGGCYAAAEFRDGTKLWVGATLNENDERNWFLAAYNPDWSWIENDKQYDLAVQVPDGNRGKLSFTGFHFNNDNTDIIIAGGLSVPTVNLFAVDVRTRVLPLRIWRSAGRLLLALDMSDSAAAIRQVVYCLRNRPFNREEATSSETPPKQHASSDESS